MVHFYIFIKTTVCWTCVIYRCDSPSISWRLIMFHIRLRRKHLISSDLYYREWHRAMGTCEYHCCLVFLETFGFLRLVQLSTRFIADNHYLFALTDSLTVPTTYIFTGVARQASWVTGAGEKWKKMQNDAFYSISGAIRTHNLGKFYLVIIKLFLSNQKEGINMTISMRYRTSPRSGLFETMILHKNTITKWSNQKYVMYSYQRQCL